MLRIKNPVDTLIDFVNLTRAKDSWILQVRANILAQNLVALIEIDIAVSICFISQPTYRADQLALNSLGLPGGWNQLLPKAIEFRSPSFI
jgi:hypothetical protein